MPRRSNSVAFLEKPSKKEHVSTLFPASASARTGFRSVYWSDLGKATKTPIYDGSLISFGQQVNGPAVVETTDTNIVVQPKQVLHVDALGNFELHFGS